MTEAAKLEHDNERTQFEEQRFLSAFRQIKELKSDIGATMADINEIYKSLKPLGFTKGDIKWAFELEEKDAGDILATMQRRIRIAKMLGHGLARQLEFIETDRTPLDDRAYDEGLAAGKLRKEMSCPFDLGSPAGQAWQRGFNDGTAFSNKELADVFADEPFPAAAE
jgi:hypothetical protein